MFTALRRHPFAVKAFFRHSLVLTFAYPEEVLRPLLPPGLTLDTYEGHGFLAIALVQTESLRPAVLPAVFGRDFFLSGYRIFTRFKRPNGRSSRGLRILRSDADSRVMVWSGNLLTHYNYRKCDVETRRDDLTLSIEVTTPNAKADLAVKAFIADAATLPPDGSPFPDLKTARRFAGPLPFTFDYEEKSGKMVVIEGVRQNWDPVPVRTEVSRCSFLESEPFAAADGRLANAFFIENIPYRWKRGVLVPIASEGS